jgi:hypothetical protein
MGRGGGSKYITVLLKVTAKTESEVAEKSTRDCKGGVGV